MQLAHQEEKKAEASLTTKAVCSVFGFLNKSKLTSKKEMWK